MTRIHSLKQEEGYGHRTHRSKKNRKFIDMKKRFFYRVEKGKTIKFNKLKALIEFNKKK